MKLSICSFNDRGLGQKLKRTQIFTFLKSKKLQICFLQETHSTKEIENTWAADNTYDFYLSGRSSNSGGICIMVDKTLDYNVKEHTEIIPGKLQALRVKMFDRNITYLNIYGPNNDDKSFFELLNKYLADNEEDEFIIGGDFNTVLEPDADKIGGISITHAKSREIIKTTMESFDLNDIWILLNNNTMQFTWHSSSKPYIFSRLDYFLVSNSIVNSVCDCTIIPEFKSDHSIVTMNIHLTSEQRGPGYFKINNSLL